MSPFAFLVPCAALGLTFEIAAAAGATDELVVFDDDVATGDDDFGVAFDVEAFEHGVIDTHVVGGGADDVIGFGVPDDDVGVAAYGDFAFLGIEAEEFGGRGGN